MVKTRTQARASEVALVRGATTQPGLEGRVPGSEPLPGRLLPATHCLSWVLRFPVCDVGAVTQLTGTQAKHGKQARCAWHAGRAQQTAPVMVV